jgi:hypothetical protein
VDHKQYLVGDQTAGRPISTSPSLHNPI